MREFHENLSRARAPILTLPVTKRDHKQHSSKAPLTLVEYGDYQCSFCGAAHEIVKNLERALGDNLCFVFRNFPLTQIHEYAMIAAEAAEAADLQGKFWPFHDMLFENQYRLDPKSILDWAAELKLDLEQLTRDMEGGTVRRRIKDDRISGINSGVNGTPTFFVNGVRYNGIMDYYSLVDMLQEQLTDYNT